MHKRRLYHFWRLLRPLNHWLFLGLAIVSGVVAVVALRDNNMTMIRLRDEVIQADKDNKNVEEALRRLREHVHGHMNTNLASGDFAIRPPIQLKYRYDRLVEAERQRVAEVNGNLYTQAQRDCERRFPSGYFGAGRIPCIQEYIADHNGAVEEPIPEALYKFDFASPRWSPDLAGWSLVAAVAFGLAFIIRWLLEWIIRAQLRSHL